MVRAGASTWGYARMRGFLMAATLLGSAGDGERSGGAHALAHHSLNRFLLQKLFPLSFKFWSWYLQEMGVGSDYDGVYLG